MWGFESYAERIEDAARRRKVMAIAADVFNLLGAGEALDVVLPLLHEAVAA
jgi:hypothetical protein